MKFPFSKAAPKDAPKEDAPAHARESLPAPDKLAQQARLFLERGSSPSDIAEYLEIAGYKGTIEDIEHIAAISMPYTHKMPLLLGTLRAYDEGRHEPLQRFIAGYVRMKGKSAEYRTLDNGYRDLMALPILQKMAQNSYPASVLKQLTDAIGSTSTLMTARELLLRQACIGDTKIEIIDAIIKAGTDVNTDEARPLINALNNNKIALATELVITYGADTETARAYALKQEKNADLLARLDTLRSALAADRLDPAEYRKLAGSDSQNYKTKLPLLQRALQEHEKSGDAGLLQSFFAGYLEFKRGQHSERKISEGYTHLLLQPLAAVLQKSAQPDETLMVMLAEAAPLDRQIALDLMLRHLCAEKHGNINLVRLLAQQGADATTMSHQPLVNALRAGHTDIALMLVREHGANPAEALFDTQVNTPSETTLIQRIYQCMAATYVPPSQQAPRLTDMKRLPKAGR